MRSRTAVQPPSWTERPPRKPAGEKANATRQSNLIPAQSMRNRCTEASGLCRSRWTVDAKVKCSSTAQLRFPDALRDPLTPHQSFPSSALTPCSTPPSTWTSAHDHPRKHLHQHFLTSLTPHPSASVVPLPSPRTIQIQHTTAVRRGASWTAAYHLQLTVAAVAKPVRSSVRALGVLAAGRSWLLLAQTASAPRSVQPVSRSASSPWSTLPAGKPRRRSPVSSMRCPPIRSRRPAVRPSGVRSPGMVVQRVRRSAVCCPPVCCPPVCCPPVCCPPSGVHRPVSRRLVSAPVRPDASVSSHLRRWRWGPGRSGRATVTTGTSGGPGGCQAVDGSINGRGGRDAGDAAESRWSMGGRWRTRAAGLGAGRGGRACPPSDQAGQAGVRGARHGRLRGGHEGQAAARGGGSRRVAAALGLGCATTVCGRRRG